MKSIIIGIDGADPKLIEKWIDELPNLQKFYFGKLETILPPSSAPAWTSIVTGVTPKKHGIYDFFYFDGSIKVISSRHRRVPAIWNLLSSIGRKSIIINVPVTYPPERINGVMISGLLTPPNENFVEPKELKAMLSDYKMEHLIVDDLPIRIAAHYNPEKVMGILYEWMKSRTKAAIRLMKNFDWDFCMVVYRATDLAQHFLWGKQEVFEIYKKVDEEIGKIMEKFKANYFIVSDHGFYGIRKNIFLNNLLYENGYVVANRRPFSLLIGKMLTKLLYHMPKNFTHLPFMRKLLFSIAFKENVIDFENSKAFCLSSSSRAIICRKEVEEEIIKLIESFEDSGKKIMELKKIFQKNGMSYLVAKLAEGYAIMDMINFGKIIEEPGKFHFRGEHGKYGIFMAYGKKIKEWIDVANVIDVMPTVLHSMNLPSPLHVEGKVIDIFKERRRKKKIDWEKFGISRREKEIIRKMAKMKI